MWIQTQNKQRVINSDQIIDIFVDRSGTKIMAETVIDTNSHFALGEYKNRDICIEVLEYVAIATYSDLPVLPMPLGGEVNTWIEGISKIVANSIVSNFVG